MGTAGILHGFIEQHYSWFMKTCATDTVGSATATAAAVSAFLPGILPQPAAITAAATTNIVLKIVFIYITLIIR